MSVRQHACTVIYNTLSAYNLGFGCTFDVDCARPLPYQRCKQHHNTDSDDLSQEPHHTIISSALEEEEGSYSRPQTAEGGVDLLSGDDLYHTLHHPGGVACMGSCRCCVDLRPYYIHFTDLS